MEPSDILDGMIEGQLPPWRRRGGPLPAGTRHFGIAERIRDRGRLVYVGAGTSGRWRFRMVPSSCRHSIAE